MVFTITMKKIAGLIIGMVIAQRLTPESGAVHPG